MMNLLNQTVTIQPPTSVDRYGNKTFGVGVEVRCRFVQKVAKFQKTNGEVVSYDATCTVKGNYPVGSKVTYESKAYLADSAQEWVGRSSHYGQQLILKDFT